MIPHSALSDDIAGEEVHLMNERLMSCNYFTNFTIFSGKNKRNHKRIFLTKVFAELFSSNCQVKCNDLFKKTSSGVFQPKDLRGLRLRSKATLSASS